MIQFFCPGLPRAKGSMRGFVVKGRALITNSSPATRSWEQDVAFFARQACAGATQGPVSLSLCFYLPRPKKPKHEQHIVKPDVDKLARAVMDALTGIAYRDDSQVHDLAVSKLYEHDANTPGVRVRVRS